MDPDPDPLARGTDPWIGIRIRTNMSRIPNTVLMHSFGFILTQNQAQSRGLHCTVHCKVKPVFTL